MTLREAFILVCGDPRVYFHPAHIAAANQLQEAIELTGSLSTVLQLLAAMNLVLADTERTESPNCNDAKLYEAEAEILNRAAQSLAE